MKTAKIFSARLFVFAFIISIGSCSDPETPVIQNENRITVTGMITNQVNQATPNVKVKIGSDSVFSSAEGAFTFTNVTTPYTIQVFDENENTSKYYYGLTSEQITIPGIGIIDESVQCEITVTYPPEILLPGVTGKIMFTDGNYVNAYTEFSQGLPLIIWLQNNSPVTGKLILLTYRKESGKIVSYENFGLSNPIQVVRGGKYNYGFSLNEVSLNPGEESVSGTVNVQPGYDTGDQMFYITFSDKRTPNFTFPIRFETITGNNFDIKLPVNIPLQYSAIFFSYTYEGSAYSSELFKLPGISGGVVIDTKEPPELLTPANNETGVTEQTKISFTSGSGDGIYHIRFHDMNSNKVYTAYSGSNSFYIYELKGIFPEGLPANTEFKWWVEKIGTNSSVNDYLTTYNSRPENFRTNSLQSIFTTAK